MRIVSLEPSTTEIVCALGLGDHLVGITHECDYPPSVIGIPVVTYNLLDCSTSSAQIDAIVGTHVRSNLTQYDINKQVFAALQPDLVVTPAFYEVCAISTMVVQDMLNDILQVAQITPLPQVLSLPAKTLNDILETIRTVGTVAGRHNQATALIDELCTRIDRVKTQLEGAAPRRVAFLESIDPPYGPGDWIPELVTMVAKRAGFGCVGQPSCRISWGDIIAFAPEVIIVSPRGFSLEQTRLEAQEFLPNRTGWQALPAVRSGQVYAVDGRTYFSRPSPRIVDSLELLAELVHPDRCCGWGPKGAAQRLDFTDAEER